MKETQKIKPNELSLSLSFDTLLATCYNPSSAFSSCKPLYKTDGSSHQSGPNRFVIKDPHIFRFFDQLAYAAFFDITVTPLSYL